MNSPIEPELKSLVEHLPYYVVVVDHETRFMWANRFDPSLKPSEVIGQPFDVFTPEDHRAPSRTVVEHCLRTGEGGYYEVPYGEGAYQAWYGCRVVALPADPQGRPRAMILSSDVGERRRAEEALARSEARFRCLVEATPDFISIVGRDRRVLYINRDPPAESGLSRADVVGMPLESLTADDTRELAIGVVDEVFRSGRPGAYDSADAPLTHHYHVDVLPFAEPGEPSPRAMVVARDITQAWRAERQREAMLAELDHRVKNTLATVQAIVEQTLARASTLEDFRETFSGRLLSLARTHETLAASHWTSVPLATVIELSVPGVSHEAVRLREGSPNPNLDSHVVTPLSLALHELGTNAAKYGALGKRGGVLELWSECPTDSSLTLHWVEHCAQPPEDGSTGLGLTLVRGLITRELGGAFDVTVAPDQRHCRLHIPVSRES